MWERADLEREANALVPAKPVKAPAKAPSRPAAPLLPPKCAQPSPWDCSRSQPSADRLYRRAVALTSVIVAGLGNKAHGPGEKGPGPFAGSWDWHSAVQAHCALLSMARVHKFDKIETWLANRLTDADGRTALPTEADGSHFIGAIVKRNEA